MIECPETAAAACLIGLVTQSNIQTDKQTDSQTNMQAGMYSEKSL